MVPDFSSVMRRKQQPKQNSPNQGRRGPLVAHTSISNSSYFPGIIVERFEYLVIGPSDLNQVCLATTWTSTALLVALIDDAVFRIMHPDSVDEELNAKSTQEESFTRQICRRHEASRGILESSFSLSDG